MNQPAQQDVYDNPDRVELRPFIPATARSVLDVGCGRGAFAGDLRAVLGTEARLFGIDPVASAVDVARAGGDYAEVWCGYFPEVLATSDEKFDLICFNDVLEHVVDPWQMLADSRQFLTPNGRVLASIPSIQYAPVVRDLLRGRWQYTDFGTLDKTHLRFFTRRSMLDLFDEAGFTVEICAGINPIGTASHNRWRLQRLAIRMLRRALGPAAYLQFAIVARPCETKEKAGG